MSKLAALVLLVAVVLGPTASVPAPVEPHGGMMRYPDVSETLIAFLYANDLWVVPKEGGVATPLASPPGKKLSRVSAPTARPSRSWGTTTGTWISTRFRSPAASRSA